MATGLYKAPRSPGRGDTIASLKRLKESNFHNPDTGTEINEGEAEVHLMQLQQKHADRASSHHINKFLRTKVRSRGRPYITGDIQFRMIHGHRVPFRKVAEPFL